MRVSFLPVGLSGDYFLVVVSSIYIRWERWPRFSMPRQSVTLPSYFGKQTSDKEPFYSLAYHRCALSTWPRFDFPSVATES